MNAQMEEMHKTKYVERPWNIHATLPKYPCVYQPTSSLNPVLWGFIGLDHIGMIKSMVIGVELHFKPLFYPQRSGDRCWEGAGMKV